MASKNELLQMLAKADDDYLTGLCNKGILKRANKDLESEKPVVSWNESVSPLDLHSGECEAVVQLKDTSCTIRMPIGESSCSCPSRSICRHIITAVLWLKREAGGVITEEKTEFKELLSIPLPKLKRACGNRRFADLLLYIKAGELPVANESTVVTIDLPWEQETVKLLEPVEYSSCTCHSKELCVHKAQALLLYQLQKKVISPEQLTNQQEQEGNWDLEALKKTAVLMKEAISIQIGNGLSRLSPEMAESMERMAVISHQAGLADFESRFREVASEYQLYFERSPSFEVSVLQGKLFHLYRMAKKLETASDQQTISQLAGTFREVYKPLPKLHLWGAGSRYFNSKTGYEGEIFYFLEPDQQTWYTWTDTRPVFYEGNKNRYYGNAEKAQAPWGLNCSREKMFQLEFYLSYAKAAGRRLSASKETQSQIVGGGDLHVPQITKMVYWDYQKILEDFFADEVSDRTGNERLVLVGSDDLKSSSFDSVRQIFEMILCDGKGREIVVTVRYTKADKMIIQVLERLHNRLLEKEKKPPVFFGSLYLKEGRLHLYPIEYFEWQHPDAKE